MRTQTVWGALALIAALLVTTTTSRARADTYYGYICSITYVPGTQGTPSFGNFGSATLSIHTQPKCAGSAIAGAYFCSTGGVHPSYCASGANYTEAALHSLIRAAEQFAQQGREVRIESAAGNKWAGRFITYTYR